MSLAINHNLMASNISRSLNQHYSRLYQSTQRLSSGLRINGAADDAAGLAIRELQRADIAALHQGARNVNDAISMIQTFDGALSVIDEKLIRMKELAEQASTGTYNSTQRLMIDSEFIAMASEINRIAVATDFNGVKLLCNDVSNKLIKGANSNTYIYQSSPSGALYSEPLIIETSILNQNPIINPIQDMKVVYTLGGIKFHKYEGDENVLLYGLGPLGAFNMPDMPKGTYTLHYNSGSGKWSLINAPSGHFEHYFIDDADNNSTGLYIEETDEHGNFVGTGIDFGQMISPVTIYTDNGYNDFTSPNFKTYAVEKDTIVTFEIDDTLQNRFEIYSDTYPGAKVLNHTVRNFAGPQTGGLDLNQEQVFEIDLDGDGNADIQQKLVAMAYIPDPYGIPTVRRDINIRRFSINIDFTTKIHFGTGNDSAEDYYYIDTRDCTLKGLGIDDLRIETQEKAQKALVRINEAIERKDNARAYFGAIQNRLENTVTNLQTQAENLQAAESRISDTDVAIEMTNFIRNQILTQSATAMLSQANSLPQMAMQIIGG